MEDNNSLAIVPFQPSLHAVLITLWANAQTRQNTSTVHSFPVSDSFTEQDLEDGHANHDMDTSQPSVNGQEDLPADPAPNLAFLDMDLDPPLPEPEQSSCQEIPDLFV